MRGSVRMANKKQKLGRLTERKPILQLRVDGPGIRKGRVPVPELVRICQDAQNAINKQAEALKKRKTYHPGPVGRSIQEECTLELVGIHGNSPTTLDFDLRKHQRGLYDEFGAEAIREIILGLRKKKEDIDPGVLLKMYSFTGVLNPNLISKIDWIAPSQNGHHRSISAPVTETVRKRLAKQLSTPRKTTVEVTGVLDMADFKKEDYKCRIDTPFGAAVLCTFDASNADDIQRLLRKNVRVKGEGSIHPYTEKVELLRIDEITPASLDVLADQSFFANPSLAEIIAESDVQPLDDPSVLAGGIPDDEDVDAMLRYIYEARK